MSKKQLRNTQNGSTNSRPPHCKREIVERLMLCSMLEATRALHAGGWKKACTAKSPFRCRSGLSDRRTRGLKQHRQSAPAIEPNAGGRRRGFLLPVLRGQKRRRRVKIRWQNAIVFKA